MTENGSKSVTTPPKQSYPQQKQIYSTPTTWGTTQATKNVLNNLGTNVSSSAKGTVARTIEKANNLADSVFGGYSYNANNQYTTKDRVQQPKQKAAKQQEIPIEKDTEYYNYDKMYPTKLHHAAMDLHNNDLGIQIALSTPNNQKDVEKELSMLLGKGETIGYLRHVYPDLNDRQILIMKKTIKAIEDGEAAIIWDFHE